jgi:hypothetical protein
MKSTYIPMLIACAAFGVARADNPPAPGAGTTPATSAAATASAATPATPATSTEHTPPKASPPWKMYTRKGKPVYCIDVMRKNSRIQETRCVDEQEYMRELSDSEQVRQNKLQGTNGCAPACAK